MRSRRRRFFFVLLLSYSVFKPLLWNFSWCVLLSLGTPCDDNVVQCQIIKLQAENFCINVHWILTWNFLSSISQLSTDLEIAGYVNYRGNQRDGNSVTDYVPLSIIALLHVDYTLRIIEHWIESDVFIFVPILYHLAVFWTHHLHNRGNCQLICIYIIYICRRAEISNRKPVLIPSNGLHSGQRLGIKIAAIKTAN